MKPSRPGEEDSSEWLRRAQSSLAHAKQVSAEIAFEDLCFDAQQSAEKAIKALLISRGMDFPYVHDLAQLLTLVERSGEHVPDAVRGAERLTIYAFATRYPGDAQPVTAEEHSEAVAEAEMVVHWAEALVG